MAVPVTVISAPDAMLALRAGANVLFADGHTRFLKDTIAAGTWRALGSRAGGDISAPEL